MWSGPTHPQGWSCTCSPRRSANCLDLVRKLGTVPCVERPFYPLGMSWPTGRAPSAPPVDWFAVILDLLTVHAADGSRCRSCGRLPAKMTIVEHQATAIHNRLVQAGLAKPRD